jgi:hypothetical protein
LVHPAHDLLLRAKRGGAFNDLMGLSIPPLATGGAILLGLVEWNPLSFGRGKKITISRLANTLSETIDSDYSDYIDLDQAAALVNRSKRTLERKVDEMPKPAIRGTGGKKHEWLYPELRPWLQQEFNKILPERPPHARRR